MQEKDGQIALAREHQEGTERIRAYGPSTTLLAAPFTASTAPDAPLTFTMLPPLSPANGVKPAVATTLAADAPLAKSTG